MFNYGNRTSQCLIILFIILGSITMMLFLKNKDRGIPKGELQVEKTTLSQNVDKNLKEVVAKLERPTPKMKRVADSTPVLKHTEPEKDKADEPPKKIKKNEVLAEQNLNKLGEGTTTDAIDKHTKNAFTGDLNEFLESDVFKDDGDGENSLSNNKNLALKINPRVVQEELRTLYRKRIEALTYLE